MLTGKTVAKFCGRDTNDVLITAPENYRRVFEAILKIVSAYITVNVNYIFMLGTCFYRKLRWRILIYSLKVYLMGC